MFLHEHSLREKFPSVCKDNQRALVAIGIPHSIEAVDGQLSRCLRRVKKLEVLSTTPLHHRSHLSEPSGSLDKVRSTGLRPRGWSTTDTEALNLVEAVTENSRHFDTNLALASPESTNTVSPAGNGTKLREHTASLWGKAVELLQAPPRTSVGPASTRQRGRVRGIFA